MSQGYTKHKLVLSIHPSTRGFGFALFEGPKLPIDWGIKATKVDKNAQGLLKIRELIDFYHPDVIVVEDYGGEGSRRCKRVQKLINNIKQLAEKNKIKTHSYSRSVIRKTFARFGAKTKYQIAKKIAEWLPIFALRLPPVRKAWMSEDYRMSIFDAASLALTFFYTEE